MSIQPENTEANEPQIGDPTTTEAINSLADSVAEVISRSRDGDKRQSLNSFVAYILFTVLLGGGFALLYHSRIGGLVKARDAALEERDAARDRAEELQNELGRRDAAARAAHDYYELIRDKRRTEVIAQYPRIDELALTAAERDFFAEGVARARAEMVDAGYLAGLDAFRRGDYERAKEELERGLAYEVEGQQAALMRYYLGVAERKSGHPDQAIRNLELALAGRVVEAGGADARYHLASAFEELGSLEEARKEYSKYASAAPTSPLAQVARRKVGQLARRIAQANAADGGQGVKAAPGPALPPRSPAPAGASAKPVVKKRAPKATAPPAEPDSVEPETAVPATPE